MFMMLGLQLPCRPVTTPPPAYPYPPPYHAGLGLSRGYQSIVVPGCAEANVGQAVCPSMNPPSPSHTRPPLSIRRSSRESNHRPKQREPFGPPQDPDSQGGGSYPGPWLGWVDPEPPPSRVLQRCIFRPSHPDSSRCQHLPPPPPGGHGLLSTPSRPIPSRRRSTRASATSACFSTRCLPHMLLYLRRVCGGVCVCVVSRCYVCCMLYARYFVLVVG